MDPNWLRKPEVQQIITVIGVTGLVVAIMLVLTFSVYQW